MGALKILLPETCPAAPPPSDSSARGPTIWGVRLGEPEPLRPPVSPQHTAGRSAVRVHARLSFWQEAVTPKSLRWRAQRTRQRRTKLTKVGCWPGPMARWLAATAAPSRRLGAPAQHLVGSPAPRRQPAGCQPEGAELAMQNLLCHVHLHVHRGLWRCPALLSRRSRTLSVGPHI